jgi:hypothetical protein
VRIVAACTLALTLAGCLSGCASSPPPVTEQERSDATDAYMACLVAADRKLDDNRSDASTIALALRPFCAAQFARSYDLFGRNLSPVAREMYDEQADATFLRVATAVVLGERAKRRTT